MTTSIKQLLANEKLLLAAFPLVAYLLTLEYQQGYLSYFQVSNELAKTDYKDVLIFTAALILIVPSINTNLSPIYYAMAFETRDRNRWKWLAFLASIYLAYYGPISAYLIPRPLQSVFFRYVTFIVALAATIILLSRWRGKSRKEAKRNQSVPVLDSKSGGDRSLLGTYVHPKAEIYLIAAAFVIFGAKIVGFVAAGNQITFTICNFQSKRLAIIRRSESTAVAVELLNETKKFSGRYLVLPWASLSNSSLSEEQVGPLDFDAPPPRETTSPTSPPSTTTNPS